MINHLSKVTTLDRRRPERAGRPGQEHPAAVRAPDEARQHQVGAGLPEEARDLRLLVEVRRPELGGASSAPP